MSLNCASAATGETEGLELTITGIHVVIVQATQRMPPL